MNIGTKFELPEETGDYMYRCQEWETEDESISLIQDVGSFYIREFTEYKGEQWVVFDQEDYEGTNAFMMRTKDLEEILGELNYEIY